MQHLLGTGQNRQVCLLGKSAHVTGVALAGILAVLHSCLDLKATIGGSQYHHILYFLTPAMKPRMLMTVDKDMNLLPVSVRVGQAVDVVAQVRRGCTHRLTAVKATLSYTVITIDGCTSQSLCQLSCAMMVRT